MFFLFILIVLLILALAIHTSKIGIEVENLVINTENSKGEKINDESKIYVYLLIFNKIKLFKKDVKQLNLSDVKLKNGGIDIKILKNKDFKINYLELIQNIDIDIKQIDLYAQIGTENAAFTAIFVGIISSLIGVILKKPKYQIVPIYLNKNLLKIKLNCIISVYLMQYIYKLIFDKTKSLGEEKSKKLLKFPNKKAEV